MKFHVITEFFIYFLLNSTVVLNTLEQGSVAWQLLFREDPGLSRVKVQGRITGIARAMPSAHPTTVLKKSVSCSLLRGRMLKAAAAILL